MEKSLAENPENVDLLYALALVEDKLGKVNDALNHYQKALSLAPRDEDVLKSLGLLYLKMGKAYEAQSNLLRARAVNADNDEVILALGKAYDAQGKYDNALECFLKLKNKKIDDEVDIHYYIAMTYGKLNIMGESHYNFGLYFKKINKKDSALFHFKKALDYFPPDSARSDAVNQEIKALNSKNTPNKTPQARSQRLQFNYLLP